MSDRPLALVIDPDPGFRGRAASCLARAGYQVRERLSPAGLRDLSGALRPELILLGTPFWDRGWAQVFRAYSPESVVFPAAPRSDDPGVADLRRLPLLLGRPRRLLSENHIHMRLFFLDSPAAEPYKDRHARSDAVLLLYPGSRRPGSSRRRRGAHRSRPRPPLTRPAAGSPPTRSNLAWSGFQSKGMS